jgi:hypothetical protein
MCAAVSGGGLAGASLNGVKSSISGARRDGGKCRTASCYLLLERFGSAIRGVPSPLRSCVGSMIPSSGSDRRLACAIPITLENIRNPITLPALPRQPVGIDFSNSVQ